MASHAEGNSTCQDQQAKRGRESAKRGTSGVGEEEEQEEAAKPEREGGQQKNRKQRKGEWARREVGGEEW